MNPDMTADTIAPAIPSGLPASAEEARVDDETTLFGFWMYLMTDFVLFASLFAVYVTLRAIHPDPIGDLFDGPFVLTETIILLASSFTCGLSLLAARAGNARHAIAAIAASSLLGAAFVALEFSEFARLIAGGNGPSRDGYLSSYFTLVGTHGLHIIVGLLWAVALMVSIGYRGLTRSNLRKLSLWTMFWHFLDLVWIFIFTIVYLTGLL